MAPARVPASSLPLGSRLDRARLAHRDETTRSSRRHPPTSRDARSRADPAPRASRPRTVSAKNLQSRFGAIRTLAFPRRERNCETRQRTSPRRSFFRVSRGEEKKRNVFIDAYRTTTPSRSRLTTHPCSLFFRHHPRAASSSTTSGPLLREVRGWHERQTPVRKRRW